MRISEGDWTNQVKLQVERTCCVDSEHDFSSGYVCFLWNTTLQFVHQTTKEVVQVSLPTPLKSVTDFGITNSHLVLIHNVLTSVFALIYEDEDDV
jgi:hypothetical protein